MIVFMLFYENIISIEFGGTSHVIIICMNSFLVYNCSNKVKYVTENIEQIAN